MIPELPKAIAANIEHFTGRTWLLPTLLEWFERPEERMFILTGGPGGGPQKLDNVISSESDPDRRI